MLCFTVSPMVVLLGSPGQHSPQSSQCLDEGCRGFGIGWGRLWHLMAYNMAIFRWDEHENEAAWLMNVEVNSFKSYENTQEVQHGIGAANASWISLKIFLLLFGFKFPACFWCPTPPLLKLTCEIQMCLTKCDEKVAHSTSELETAWISGASGANNRGSAT